MKRRLAGAGGQLEQHAGSVAGIVAAGVGALLLTPGIPTWIIILAAGLAYTLTVIELDLPKTVAREPSRAEKLRISFLCGGMSVASGFAIEGFVLAVTDLDLEWGLFGLFWCLVTLGISHYYSEVSGYTDYKASLGPEKEREYSRSANAALMFSMALGLGLGDFLIWWGLFAGGTVAGLIFIDSVFSKELPRGILSKTRRYGTRLEGRLWKEVREAGDYPGAIYPLYVASQALFFLAFFLPFTDSKRLETLDVLAILLLLTVVVIVLAVVILDLQHWSWSYVPAVCIFGAISLFAVRPGTVFPFAENLRLTVLQGLGPGKTGAEAFASEFARRAMITFSIYFLISVVTSLPLHKFDVADWKRDTGSKRRWLRVTQSSGVLKTVLLWGMAAWIILPLVDDLVELAPPELSGTPFPDMSYRYALAVVIGGFLVSLGIQLYSYRRARKRLAREAGE